MTGPRGCAAELGRAIGTYSRPVPEDLYVDASGLRLHVLTWKGPRSAVPVVLLHATGETAQDWNVVAERLASTRAVHAVDLPGHGSSDWTGDYSIEGMSRAVVALLERLAADRPVDLVGHSLGGLVACRAAAAGPQWVRRLVLEDIGVLRPRAAAPPARPPGDLRFDWRIVEQVRPQIDSPADDWPTVLASIAAPTLVIAGGAASPVSVTQVAELTGLVPNARHVTVEAGHLVHAHEPEDFVREVLRFIDD